MVPVGAGSSDTIVACATGEARAAIAVVRLSGPQARIVAERLAPGGPPWRPRRAQLRVVRDDRGGRLDDALVTWFRGPRSATGDDVVELGLHGSPVLVRAVVDRAVALGARLATPGEFTRRAVLAGRLNLLDAEEVDAVVRATTLEGVVLARQGGLGERADALRDVLLDVASALEAMLDHPEEDRGTNDDVLLRDLARVADEALALALTYPAARRRLEGARVALVGPVNAGKSSLFNRLVGRRRALVSDTPGTTRDVVEATTDLGGLAVTWLDTAGEGGSDAPLEVEGVALGRAMVQDADLLLVVVPLHQPVSDAARDVLAATAGRARIVVGSHSDRSLEALPTAVDVTVSSTTGAGVDVLAARILACLREGPSLASGAVVLSQRQEDVVRRVAHHAAEAGRALVGTLGPVVAAEEVTQALEALAELTGADAREDVLDRLFARFCIGK